MKRILITLICFSFTSLVNAQGIKFYKGNFTQALAKAKKEKKLVFIDFYTTWCGPCKEMDANIFPHPEVGAFFNKKFVAIKLDAEKGEGITLAKKFKVTGYPTLVYLKNNGVELGRLTGAASNSDFFINYTKQAIGEGEKFTDVYARYIKKGGTDLVLMQRILQEGPVYAQGLSDEAKVNEWYDKFEKIANSYFKLKPKKQLLNSADFNLIAQYFDGPNNHLPIVQFVYKHYNEYKKLVPLNSLVTFVLRTNNQSINEESANGKIIFREYVEDIKTKLKQAHIDEKIVAPDEKGDSYMIMKMVGEAAFALFHNKYDQYLDWCDKYARYMASEEGDNPGLYSSTFNIMNVQLADNPDKPRLTQQQFQKFHKYLKKAIQKFPKDVSLRQGEADLYAIHGKKSKAILAYQKMLQMIKGDPYEEEYKKEINTKIQALKKS